MEGGREGGRGSRGKTGHWGKTGHSYYVNTKHLITMPT